MGEKLLYILATEENSTENFQPIKIPNVAARGLQK